MRASAALLALSLVGCFSGEAGPTDASSEALDAGNDLDGTTCGFTCLDVVDDRPLFLRVKGDLDNVCGSPDGCHGGGADKYLGITAMHDFDQIIDVEAGEMPEMVYVKPFFPLDSYLFLKVRCEGGIDGSCMPMGSPTEQWRVDLYHAWIEAGAPTQ